MLRDYHYNMRQDNRTTAHTKGLEIRKESRTHTKQRKGTKTRTKQLKTGQGTRT